MRHSSVLSLRFQLFTMVFVIFATSVGVVVWISYFAKWINWSSTNAQENTHRQAHTYCWKRFLIYFIFFWLRPHKTRFFCSTLFAFVTTATPKYIRKSTANKCKISIAKSMTSYRHRTMTNRKVLFQFITPRLLFSEYALTSDLNLKIERNFIGFSKFFFKKVWMRRCNGIIKTNGKGKSINQLSHT